MFEKEYYTLEETATLLKRNRATVYNRMNLIGIKGHKFQGDRKTYLTADEVKRLKTVFEKPWTAPEKGGTSTESGIADEPEKLVA